VRVNNIEVVQGSVERATEARLVSMNARSDDTMRRDAMRSTAVLMIGRRNDILANAFCTSELLSLGR
jgi:hypothetical protein